MWILLLVVLHAVNSIDVDPKGYIVYCPCMGRFGNQVDQTLGAIAFAKGLDRTLILPPFIDFNVPGKADMTPFEDVFQPKALASYTKVITLKDFKREIAAQIWPKSERKAICWTPRESYYEKGAAPGCHAKEGNPFGPFWDYVGVDFVSDEYFGDILTGYELGVSGARKQWMEKFPPQTHPVLAFTGAPGAFPSKKQHWEIQKHLKWNGRISRAARKFINETLTRPYVGIHLRNNVDWTGVCEHVHKDRTDNLFASAQCLGEVPMKGSFSKELCLPSKQTVVEAVTDIVGRIGAKSVYVTSDKDFMLGALDDALSAYDVKAFTLKEENQLLALAILEEADHFIGNCISTFSAVVSRHRQYAHESPLPTTFFGHIPRSDEIYSRRKIEL